MPADPTAPAGRVYQWEGREWTVAQLAKRGRVADWTMRRRLERYEGDVERALAGDMRQTVYRHGGRYWTVADLARHTGLCKPTVRNRLRKNGGDVADLLSESCDGSQSK
jgi:hypothetical protein